MILPLIAVFLASRDVRAEEPLCEIAKTAIKDASRIRNLSQRSPVPCKVELQSDVKKYLLETVDTRYPKEKLAREERVYKALGFIPPDFDYTKGLIDFYASQVGGYYDPEKKSFVMAGWIPEVLQKAVAVHELTHALEDQHFDLKEFTDVEKYSTDELLARSALVEGDATAVMTDYARGLVGQKLLRDEKNVESALMQNVLGMAMIGGEVRVPRSLQMLVFFPYTSGLRFVHALLKKEGYRGVDEAFRLPPRSTREILHPEEYKPGENNSALPERSAALQAPGERYDGPPVYADTLGEFFISVLIGYLTEDQGLGSKAGAGWAGDRVVMPRDGGPVYWTVKFGSPADLDEFVDAYGAALKQKRKAGTYAVSVDRGSLATTIRLQ